MTHQNLRRFALILVLLASFSGPAHAYNRRYVYSYEAGGMPKGLYEFEPWFTFKNFRTGHSWEFRNEIEYAVTDRFLLSAYLSDWSTEKIDGKRATSWNSGGIELLYTMTDPTVDFIGSAVYGEVLVGPDAISLENKLILNKNFGPVSVVYNLVLETEWEGQDYSDMVGVIENTFGVSYQFNPRFFIGMEGTQEVELEEWSDAGDNAIYIGPNISFRTSGMNQPGKGAFFATAAMLWQTSSIDEEAQSQIRLIMGKFF
jgi:hypothetical protein